MTGPAPLLLPTPVETYAPHHQAEVQRRIRDWSGGVNARLNTIPKAPFTVDLRDYSVKNGGDATAALNKAGKELTGTGGAIWIPPGRWGATNVMPYSNVDYLGAGPSSQLYLIENSTDNAHIFYAAGLDRATYHLRNWYPLNTISAGTTVTLTTAANASHFSPGDMVVITTTGHASGGGTDEQPYLSVINKVVSASTSTGVIALESPFYEGWSSVQIAKQGDWSGTPPANDDQWCANSSFQNLYFDLTTTPSGIQSQALSTNGLYQCLVRNVTMDGAWALHSANGVCYTTFEHVQSLHMAVDSTNTLRFLETKTGSYDATYRDVIGICDQTAAVTQALIEPGEYAHWVTYDGVRFHGPNVSVNFTYAVGPSSSVGRHYHFRHLDFALAAAQSFCSANFTADSGFPDIVDLEFSDCVVDSPACSLTVRTVPNTLGTTQLLVDGVTAVQPPAAYGAFIGAMYIGDLTGFSDVRLHRISSDGTLYWLPTGPMSGYPGVDLTVTDCEVSGWTFPSLVLPAPYDPSVTAQPWQCHVERIARFGAGAVRKALYVESQGNATYVTTVGSTTVVSLTPPNWASFAWAYGDAIRFELTGRLVGTAGAKSVTLTETVTATTLATFSNTTDLNFTVSGALGWYGPGNFVSGIVTTTLDGSAPTMVKLNTSCTGFAFTLVATVATAPDYVEFYRVRFRPELAYADGRTP